MDEFIKYLPSVSTASMGPGQSNVYMRGLSVGALGTQGSGTNGTWPNVAVYLDEQSTQVPGRNLDLYAADLERIEVLTGPQGTLFGAGAQAGVLRFITNKPQLDEWSSKRLGRLRVHGSMAATATTSRRWSTSRWATRFAARIVAYQDHRGGYIDNVFSTFTRSPTDLGFALRTDPTARPSSASCRTTRS